MGKSIYKYRVGFSLHLVRQPCLLQQIPLFLYSGLVTVSIELLPGQQLQKLLCHTDLQLPHGVNQQSTGVTLTAELGADKSMDAPC